MPFKIILPASIIISILVGGLTKYYTDRKDNNNNHIIPEDRDKIGGEVGGGKDAFLDPQRTNYSTQNTIGLLSHTIFAVAYITLLVILVIFFGLNYNNPFHNKLFEPWQQFTAFDIMKLVSAIALSFFFPGYALVNVIFLDRKKKEELKTLPKILLAYIFSMAIAGFTAYVTALLGFAVSDIKLILIVIHVTILVLFLRQVGIIPFTRILFNNSHFNSVKVRCKITHRLPNIIIFGSLLALVILSTYVLYDGVIVGDQWFHHGRALQFISGDYKAISLSNIDFPYPPLLSSMLSSFFVLADVPTVNAYASVGFLNIVSVFAFYYFFQNWTPIHRKRAALLAAVLFVLSSGFGWIYATNTFIGHQGPESQQSALLTILAASKQTYDIRSPSTFLLASHPDISTGLQLIVLPIGFVLLGMIKDEKINPKKNGYFIVIISAIVVFGIFSHDEIYFFIIIACILPIIFGLRNKDFIYVGILAANGFAILANYALLEGYLSVTVIMGIPLIVLSFLFVIIMWAVYSSRILEKVYHYIAINKIVLSKHLSPLHSYTKFTVSVVLVLIIFFLYTFSYITWAELSAKDIEIQTSELFPRNVPWYLYPMKLGLAGILGLCFMVSYIFRKFEKEIFVFGVIIIVALITGPYYDEQRFNKYVMIGLIGFASLLVYDLVVFINHKLRYRNLLNGALIGVVIILSCLSTLMFIGFQASSIETNNLDYLWEGRRNFPSSSELHMLQFLQNNNTGSDLKSPEIYNIVTWPNEYQLKLGLIGKFEAFLGVPIPKMLQSPLALNSSTLESFYNLLARSKTRFIVVPSTNNADKGDALFIDNTSSRGLEHDIGIQQGEVIEAGKKGQEMKPILEATDIFDFALANFQKIYQDENFTILSVPGNLTPPSSTGGAAAMIHAWAEDVSTISNNTNVKITLPYTSEFFSKIADSEFTRVSKDKKSLLLYTYNKSQTLWSQDIEYKNGNFDYVEAKFRVTDQNRDKQHNECGIVWKSEGEKKYYVRIRDDKLEFSETPVPKDRFIIESQQVKLGEWVSYSLKLVFSEKTLDVYVDDLLRLQAPKELYQVNKRNNISRIGITCSGNIAEFEPIKIAQIGQIANNSDFTNLHHKQLAYEYFYPLTALALSGMEYDTFLPNDYSFFSRDNIIVTSKVINDYYGDDVKLNESANITRLLDYVKKGGKLTILCTDTSISGWIARAFAINTTNSSNSEFNNVVESTEPKYPIELSGTTMGIHSTSSDIVVKSYYQKNSDKISPFTLEKNYGKGKIILVNAAGYFDAISRSPDKYFSRLADIARLIGIDPKNSNKNTELRPIDPNYYIGNMRISGTFTIGGSSLVLLNSQKEDKLNNYYVQDISVLTGNTEAGDQITFTTKAGYDNNNSSQHSVDFEGKKTKIFRDILMNNIEVYGPYKATIKSSGSLSLPSPSSPLSQSNYMSLSVPAGFDITLTINNETNVKITMANGTEKTVKFANYNRSNNNADRNPGWVQIYFHNIRLDHSHANSVPVLMKRPEIIAYGNISFESIFQGKYDFDLYKGIEGGPLEIREGNIHLKLDYVDSYHSSSRNKQTADYITYLELPNAGELSKNTMEEQSKLRMPGDISDAAKQRDIKVPWEKALSSSGSIVTMIFFSVGGILILFVLGPRLKKNQIFYH
jgi:hypothetical protein